MRAIRLLERFEVNCTNGFIIDKGVILSVDSRGRISEFKGGIDAQWIVDTGVAEWVSEIDAIKKEIEDLKIKLEYQERFEVLNPKVCV